MRTGIFGGTFNPPHKGHALSLKAFAESARLDRAIVIPTYLPPHKSMLGKSVDFDDRLNMCRIAFEDVGCDAIFSDIERSLFFETGEKNYTWRTLERLKESYPEDTFCLFVGGDMLASFHSWKNPGIILSLAELWVMPRGDGNDGMLEEYREELVKSFEGCTVRVIDAVPFKASSTDVRLGNTSLLSRGVLDYILKKGLYK